MSSRKDIARLLFSCAGSHLRTASEADSPETEERSCIQGVILFQTGMEAVINEEINNHPLLEEVRTEELELNKRYKSLSFKNKWKRAYDVLQIRDDEHLLAYLTFYSQYRSPISHPRSRYLNLDEYRFSRIISGIESGWYAMQLLFAILGKDLTSWEEFCRNAELDILKGAK